MSRNVWLASGGSWLTGTVSACATTATRATATVSQDVTPALRLRRVPQPDMQLAQLLFADRGRRAGQQVLAALRLGESDDVPDRFGARHQGHHAVEAEGDAAVRRRAVLQRIEQEAELRALVLGRDFQGAKHLLLHLLAMDAHRAAADLPAVEHRVVGLGVGPLWRALDVVLVTVLRAGERMMARLPLPGLGVELEHREIDYPERPPALLRQSVLVAELLTQFTQVGVHCRFDIGAKKKQLPVFGARTFQYLGKGARMQVLHDRRLQAFGALRTLVDFDPGQPFRAKSLDVIGIASDLAAGQRTAARQPQRTDAAARRVRRPGEHLEINVLHHVGELH